jgi:hypothetical protein
LRRRGLVRLPAGVSLDFAYADPPYPGTAAQYYRNEPDYQGEVDHRELIHRLREGDYAGWALSTSSRSLVDILPLCPRGARVCSWVKPSGVPSAMAGIQSRWEALIVVGGRQLKPGTADRLVAYPARGGGTLVGRKPSAFCAWLFGTCCTICTPGRAWSAVPGGNAGASSHHRATLSDLDWATLSRELRATLSRRRRATAGQSTASVGASRPRWTTSPHHRTTLPPGTWGRSRIPDACSSDLVPATPSL